MKIRSLILLLLVGLLCSCASTTVINSEPPGAKLYLNGEYVGETPYSYTSENIIFTSTGVKLEKEGYDDFYSSFDRSETPNVGAIVGGCFIWPFWLWALDYNPARTYVLEPIGLPSSPSSVTKETDMSKDKAERLREFKKLLDEGIITQEEFEREKRKILDE